MSCPKRSVDVEDTSQTGYFEGLYGWDLDPVYRIRVHYDAWLLLNPDLAANLEEEDVRDYGESQTSFDVGIVLACSEAPWGSSPPRCCCCW